jgi:catechol 2,3-dioxygenase-like lactoylglutathione lyase family enzyme
MLDGARIFHVNVNCSDLEVSRAFYVDRCGLTEGVRTTPGAVQSGAAFGLDRARWDAWILVGAAGFDGGAVDLLEWHEPRPAGVVPGPTECGFARIGIGVTDARVGVGGPRSDPDGVAVDVVVGQPSGLAYVAVRCADRDRSLAFYDALGFRAPDSDTGHDELALDAPGGGPVQVRLGRAPDDATVPRPRPANARGIWRTALLLRDLDTAVARLRSAGIALISAPQAMAMGPGVPELRFVCLRGPDHEVIELIESPLRPDPDDRDDQLPATD